MKRLTLLRHAKSSWAGPGQPDVARPLNARGRRDAPLTGRRLRAAGAVPDLIVTSSAVRARTTAEAVAAALGCPAERIAVEPGLYLAPPERLLETASLQDDAIDHLMLVAHNPGLTELLSLIGDRPLDNLPTCGVQVIDLPITTWADAPFAPRGLVRLSSRPKDATDPPPVPPLGR